MSSVIRSPVSGIRTPTKCSSYQQCLLLGQCTAHTATDFLSATGAHTPSSPLLSSLHLPVMSSCLCPHLLPTQGPRTLLVQIVHVLLASVALGRHPGQILLGRSDDAPGHLASHMPRSRWHHTHPDTPGNTDSPEGLCDLVSSLICLPGFQVPSKCS